MTRPIPTKWMKTLRGRGGKMNKPDYCSQNNGDCLTCSLKNYGRDCMNKSIAARELGSSKSIKKSKTSAENGKKGGRPKKKTDAV